MLYQTNGTQEVLKVLSCATNHQSSRACCESSLTPHRVTYSVGSLPGPRVPLGLVKGLNMIKGFSLSGLNNQAYANAIPAWSVTAYRRVADCGMIHSGLDERVLGAKRTSSNLNLKCSTRCHGPCVRPSLGHRAPHGMSIPSRLRPRSPLVI